MGVIWVVLALLWGAAEASLFFIVPDVLLTAATLRSGWRAGLGLSALAAFAAALTGIVMWLWGRDDPAGARQVMLMVPAIGPDLLARTAHEMAGYWPLQLFRGAITGVPYKLYAIEAGARHVPLLPFILVSFTARLARFALSVALTTAGAALLERLGRRQWRYGVLALGWMLVYAVYFTIRAHAA